MNPSQTNNWSETTQFGNEVRSNAMLVVAAIAGPAVSVMIETDRNGQSTGTWSFNPQAR
jgi:hypothetical protein